MNDIMFYMHIVSNNRILSKSKVKKREDQKNNKKTLLEFSDVNNPLLLKIQTVFPFVIFPDILRIDLQKVSITHIDFFWTFRVRVINISDILGVSVQTGPFFATLMISTKFYNQNPLKISYLHKSEAMLARRIILGLIIVLKQKLEIKETNKNRIIQMLENIGQIR